MTPVHRSPGTIGHTPAGAGITAVGSVHGNVSAARAADNALQLLDVAGRPDVPVAVGAARPMAQPLHTAEFVHGHDGLGGVAETPTRSPVTISAASSSWPQPASIPAS